MHNIWIVVKQEIITTLSKRSYWIMTFLFPIVVVLLNVGTQVVTNNEIAKSNQIIPSEASSGQASGPSVGYVDQAGLIQKIPADIPDGYLKAFSTEAAAKAALQTGELDKYVLIPADFLQTGKLVEVERNFSPLGNTQDSLFRYLLTYNLTGNVQLTAALTNPAANLQSHSLAPQTGNDQSSPLAMIVPYATLFIFFFLLTTSSGLMLQSVSREKENRIVEVLLLSLQPRHLMMGKILGLSVVALLQMVLWVGGGVLLLNRGQQIFNLASNFQVPTEFIIAAVLFFLLGYLLYASLMGAIGALAPNAREGGQFTFIVLLPLMLPLFLNTVFIQAPNSTLPVILSIFPLSAPSAMMTRLASGGVPLWQLGLSLAGLAVTTYLLVSLAARFFRADTLLSSEALKWDRLVKEAKGAK